MLWSIESTLVIEMTISLTIHSELAPASWLIIPLLFKYKLVQNKMPVYLD